jgi:hypothetical protein
LGYEGREARAKAPWEEEEIMAFIIDIPDHILKRSIHIASYKSLGRRSDGSDGTYEQQLFGIIGQNVVLNAVGLKLMEPSETHDGGVDLILFGMKFDIKTMGRTVDPKIDFVNNFMESQIKFDVDGYIFTSINKTTMRICICGWLPKQLMIERASRYRKDEIRTRQDGTSFQCKAPMLEIFNSNLNNSFRNWAELFSEIHNHIKP